MQLVGSDRERQRSVTQVEDWLVRRFLRRLADRPFLALVAEEDGSCDVYEKGDISEDGWRNMLASIDELIRERYGKG